MLSKFHDWYVTNQDSITWFLIGVLVSGGIDALVRRDYVGAAWLLFFAVGNYMLRKVRLR